MKLNLAQTPTRSPSGQTGLRWLAVLTLAATLVACPPTPTDDPDPDPASMTFTTRENQLVNTDVDSNEVTPTGYNATAGVIVQGGKYSIDGGPFTNANGTIKPGQKIKLQGRSATTENSTTSVLLRIGTTEEGFTIRTGTTSPSNGNFTPVTDANVGQRYDSNEVTLSGMTIPVTISVIGGEYRIGTGGWKVTPDVVSSGDVVQVRGVAPATLGTSLEVKLRVGTKTLSFSITTRSGASGSEFISQTGLNWNQPVESNEITLENLNPNTPISVTGGEYRISSGGMVGTYTGMNSTVNAGDKVRVRGTTASADNTSAVVNLTLGSGPSAQVRSFTITTGKRIPNAFSLTDASNLDPNTTAEASLVLSSITIPTPVSVSGASGEYRINNGAFTSAPGLANPNDTITVRGKAPGTADGASANVVLVVGRDALNPSGGQSDTFTVSSKDWNPAVSFTPITASPNYSPGNELFWTGLAQFPCTGASGDWRYICPTPQPNISVTFNPYVGSLNESLSYTFSNTVTLAANSISPNTPFVITGGEYRKNGGAFTAAPGTVSPGDTLQVRNNVYIPGSSATATVTFGGTIGPTTYTFPKTFGVTANSVTRKDVWTPNAVTSPLLIPDLVINDPNGGPTLTSKISIPTTTAKVSHVRVLVTFDGAFINRAGYVVKLIPPAASGKPTLTLLDFVSNKTTVVGSSADCKTYLPAGINPIDPRYATPCYAANTLISVPLIPALGGTQNQRPWPWYNAFDPSLTQPVPFRLTDGGWGGPVDTIFDSSLFGTDGKALPDTITGANNKRETVGLGQDTYLDGGYNRNDVYRRCGSSLYLEARQRYTASQLQTGTVVETLNASLSRDLPRRLTNGNNDSNDDTPTGPTGLVDPYTGKQDRRGVLGEYTDGNCKRKDNQTYYPPVAPDPRIGDLTSLNGINPTGDWTLEIKDYSPAAGTVTLTAFKLIFDFTP